MIRMKLFTTAVMLLFATGAQSQEVLRMSLEQAQQYAIDNAFNVRSAQLDAAKAEREVKETLSAGLPQVNGTLEYNNFIDIPVQVAPADAFGFPDYLTQFLAGVAQETGVPLNAPAPDPDGLQEFQFGNEQTVTAGFTASQLIFDGSFFIGLQAQKAYAEAMRVGVRKSEAETRQQVAEAYHMVLISQENVTILKDSRGVLENSLEETRALYENGFAEAQDVDQLELSLADLDSRIKYAEQQEEVTLDMLKFQIGLDLSAELELTDTVDSLVKGDEVALLSAPLNLDANPEVMMQQNYVRLAELGIKNEKARRLPSINAFYTYQQNAQRNEFSFFDGGGRWFPIQLWGVQLNWPIFGSSMGYQRIEKAKVDLEKAEAALQQIEQGARLEYRSAKIDFDNALEQRSIQQRNMALAERIYNTTQVKYNEGMSSSFELSQAQNQMLTTQGNYINATLQLLNARTRLNKALNNF